ncbi:helix-turn-helix transcriptional regulator [Ferrimonas senticii]|uniref:helix-turn-helix transcriptional regulator n=1 Tax=Ferrimonas senticii TaxID=394566 RepID=UPI000420D890|nr:AlpA family phage regulatory protein [Ferrimonas senticii]
MTGHTINLILTRKELLQHLPFSSSTLSRKIKQGTFPTPINDFDELGKKYWSHHEVQQWLKYR